MAFSALFAERNDFKNRCEALTLENQCIYGSAAEAKELRERMSDREKTDLAAKTTFKSCGKTHNIAADK